MVTITATSVQDTTKSGTATVVVTTTPQVIELGLGQSPNLIVDFNGNVDLSWLQVGSLGNVIFAQSTDRGNTFVPKMVTTPAPVLSLEMAVDGQGDINLLWQNGSGGALFGNSMDGGMTFLQTDISSLIPNVGSPQLTVTSSGTIDVSQITRFPGMGQGVFSTVLTNRGAGSNPHVEIASNAKDGDFDAVAASGSQGQIYVSWQMQSEDTPRVRHNVQPIARRRDDVFHAAQCIEQSIRMRRVSAVVCGLNRRGRLGLDDPSGVSEQQWPARESERGVFRSLD